MPECPWAPKVAEIRAVQRPCGLIGRAPLIGQLSKRDLLITIEGPGPG